MLRKVKFIEDKGIARITLSSTLAKNNSTN